jgi:RNA polymerase primary sigma factor
MLMITLKPRRTPLRRSPKRIRPSVKAKRSKSSRSDRPNRTWDRPDCDERVRSLLSKRIDFIASPEFEADDADSSILGESEHATSQCAKQTTPTGVRKQLLPSYLASLYDVPLLEPAEERVLFRRFNFLKFQAARLQRTLRIGKARLDCCEQLESLLHAAEVAREQLIRANLRLVVSLAKKYADAGTLFDELVSDGNVSLMRAVEKFNYQLGNRFSTYATHAIRRNYFRIIACQRQFQARYVTDEESLRQLPAGEASRQLDEGQVRDLRQSFEEMLSQLDQRERWVVRERFGLDATAPKTFQELGEGIGVCKERVRQIQTRAIMKLRRMADRQRLDLLLDDVA